MKQPEPAEPPTAAASFELIDSVDEAIEKTGPCGRFQVFSTFILIIGYMTGELIVQNMAFLELFPEYECYDPVSAVWDNCMPEQFCGADQTYDREMVRVDLDDAHSLQNWVDQYDLTCIEHAKIGLLGTMIFLGWMTSSMFVPRMSDIFGRKKFFLGFQVMQVLAIIALLYVKSFGAALFSLFCVGFAGVGRSPIVFIYMQEFLTAKYQKLAGPIFAASLAACLFLGTFLFQQFTKDTTILSYISLAASIVVMILTAILIPESPKYFHATGQYERCRETLQYMAHMNGGEMNKNIRFTQELTAAEQLAQETEIVQQRSSSSEAINIRSAGDDQDETSPFVTGGTGEASNETEGNQSVAELVEQETEQEHANLSDLWDTRKPYLSNLLIMMLCWQALGFTNTLISFEMKYLEGDIFINSFTAAFAETVAKLGAGVLLVKFGSKPLFAAAFLIAFMGASNLLYLSEGADPILASIFIMMTKFGVSMGWVAACMCLIELFPASLVATAFGICNVSNKLVCMIAPIVAEVEPPTPMFIVAIITAIAGLLSQKFKLKHEPLKEA